MSWKRRLGSMGAFCVWLTASALGFAWLMRYETRPGLPAQSPQTWPDDSRLPREPQCWTLVLFLHPHCPCSNATLDELAVLQARAPKNVRTILVFCRPPGTTNDWGNTALRARAATMKDVVLREDDGDQERRRFGAATSGQALLYDASHRLRYSGGITRGRGVTGDNPGRTHLEKLLHGRETAEPSSPVFGCSLADQPMANGRRECPCRNAP
jgi:hypothetical protein